jgi:uncharacterized protein YukE
MAKENKQAMTVEGLRTLSQTYQRNAADCDDIGKFLNNQAAQAYWQSGAAETFRSSMSKYQSTLKSMHDDFQMLASEVTRRADLLEQTQKG